MRGLSDHIIRCFMFCPCNLVMVCAYAGVWIIGDTAIVHEMRHRIDEDPLSLEQFQDGSIVLGRDDGGFLAVYHAGQFSVKMTCMCL